MVTFRSSFLGTLLVLFFVLPCFASRQLPLLMDDGAVSRGEILVYGLSPNRGFQSVNLSRNMPMVIPAQSHKWHFQFQNGNLSRNMPMASIFDAFVYDHAPAWGPAFLIFTLSGLFFGFIFILANQIESFLGGVFALGFYFHLILIIDWAPFISLNEMGLFILMAALLAVLLSQNAWSIEYSYVVGGVIGCSLLIRSELFLFPLILAPYLNRLARPRIPLKEVFPILIVPYLMLISWVYMNHAIYGRWIIFENGRADNNVVAGALGLVQTMEGNFRKLAGYTRGTSPLLWAMRETLRHPLRFGWAYLQRLWFVFNVSPIMTALALWGAWKLRSQESIRRLMVFCGYYIGIHCLMPVESRYFIPIEPILCVLASVPISLWVKSRWGFADKLHFEIGRAWFRVFVGSAVLFFFVFGLGTEILIAAYPLREARAQSLGVVIENHPKDAWLWWWLGRQELISGNAQKASHDFRQALKLRMSATIALDEAWVEAVLGQNPRLLLDSIISKNSQIKVRSDLIEMIFCLDHAQMEEAASYWLKALDLWRQTDVVERGNTRKSKMISLQIRSLDDRIVYDVRNLLSAWPVTKRVVLLTRLEMVFKNSAVFKRQKTRDLFLQGLVNISQDLTSSGKFEKEKMTYISSAQKLYQEQKYRHYAKALKISNELVRRYPNIPDALNDRAVIEDLMGRKKKAIQDLKTVISQNQDFLPAYLTLISISLSENRKNEIHRLCRAALNARVVFARKQVEDDLRKLCLTKAR